MKKLSKRMDVSRRNVFHKSACDCLTRCICGCTGSGSAGDLNWVENQIQYNQLSNNVYYP